MAAQNEKGTNCSSSSTSHTIGTPLLETIRIRDQLLDHHEEEEEEEEVNNSSSTIRNFNWRRIVNVNETKRQLGFSLPLILTNLFYYLIPVVSVMFAGHLGEVELAGSNLANSWFTVTGLSLMVGLSGALETLCGQGYGAELYPLLGLYLQSSCIISLFFSLIVAVIWLYTKPILVFLHQSESIASRAAIFLRYLIPGIFAYGFIQNILRFLQTQSVVLPLVLCSLLPLVLHVSIAYLFVYVLGLGYVGAPLAASVSLWVSALMLILYVKCGKEFKKTWTGLSFRSLAYVIENLKLALPSAAMVCFEYWAFEILVLLAGLMPDSEVTTSLVAMCVNTEAIGYMISYGLSAAASTRVSNELGAGNPDQAKRAMAVSIKLSFLLTLIVILALGFGHNIWAGLFSNNSTIISLFASMTPFLLVSILLDSIQGVLSGITRGCGWQHLAMYTNLITFYLVGMPIACLLAFKLQLLAKGLWIGIICGLSCQATCLFLITYFKRWAKLDLTLKDGQQQDVTV